MAETPLQRKIRELQARQKSMDDKAALRKTIEDAKAKLKAMTAKKKK